MRIKSIDSNRENPFNLTKASDYSDLQVKEFWVDMVNGGNGLVELLKPKSLLPMFLLGGKGSGKTHLLRYCSSAVQGLLHEELRAAISKEQYIAAYTSADGLNVHRFAGKGQSDDIWEGIFAFSFELWLVGSLLGALRPAIVDEELKSEAWNDAFVAQVFKLLHVVPEQKIAGFDDLVEYLNGLRRNVDLIVNNSAISRSLAGIQITFNPGDLVFGIPKIIAELCTFAENAIFVYLIDEVENLTEQQQRFLNTLVRYRKGNTTLRIGARLYGIKTAATLGSGEPIKRDAEFETIVLDAELRDHPDQYEKLAVNLILKRLEPYFPTQMLTEASLAEKFEEPVTTNYYQNLAHELVKARDASGKDRPHLKQLKNHASRVIGDAGVADQLVEALKYDPNPVLEKTNILAFYKRLNKGCDPLALANEVRGEANAFLEHGVSSAQRYYELYSHFSSDLFAQLCRDYGKKPMYAGFKTLIRISQGVPRNLLSLLKHIYRRSVFMGESPFCNGLISVSAQMQGVQDAAEWFWEDAQPDSHGTVVRNAVEHIGTLMRSVRYSDSPSECDLCSFRVNVGTLSESARQALKMAENWSFIVRVSGNSGAKNDDVVLAKYQVNPMLAARWGLSESRRGAIELKGELAEAMFVEQDESKVTALINDRVDAMNLPKILAVCEKRESQLKQTGLFDGI